MAANWQVSYLRALGIKPTAEAQQRLASWQRWEGGSTNNSAKNNYMNTKLSMPGSWDAIGNGVQGYSTLAQGAQAFAKTLKGRSDYAPLVDWIATGGGDPTHALGVWVAGPGGAASKSALEYASKVLGGNGHPTGTNQPPVAATPDQPSQAVVTGVDTPASIQTNVADIRSAARAGLQGIATGSEKPTDALAGIPQLIRTLHASVPRVELANAPAPGGAGTASGLDKQAVALAQKYIGVKYTWGGTNAQTGFDCSGLVQTVWKQLGVDVPRTTYSQWDAGKPVPMRALKPGDAVFFTGSDPQGGKPGHEGLYIGNGKFIEAPGSGKQVRISSLAGRSDYVGARRFG